MVDILWGVFLALFLLSLLLGFIAQEVYGGYRKQEDFLMGWALTLIIAALIVAGIAMYITKGEQDELNRTVQEVGTSGDTSAGQSIRATDDGDGQQTFYQYGGRAGDFVYSIPASGA